MKKYGIKTQKTGTVDFSFNKIDNDGMNRIVIHDRERGVYVTVNIQESGNVRIYHDNNGETEIATEEGQ